MQKLNIVKVLNRLEKKELLEKVKDYNYYFSKPMNNIAIIHFEEKRPSIEIISELLQTLYSNLKGTCSYIFAEIKEFENLTKKIEFASFLLELNFPKNKTTIKSISTENNSYLKLIIDLQNQINAIYKVEYIQFMFKLISLKRTYFEFKRVKLDLNIDIFEDNKKYTKNLEQAFYKSFNGKPATPMELSDLPQTQEAISNMPNQKIVINGSIFFVEEKQIPKGYIYLIYITDYKESAILSVFKDQPTIFPIGKSVIATGIFEFDKYHLIPILNRAEIEFSEIKFDDPFEFIFEEEKNFRTELHVHSTFSQLDALSSVEEYFKNAKKLGIDALAITDHENVQNFPDVEKYSKEYGIKPIYGVELNMVDDEMYKIYYPGNSTKKHIVAFDIETTGFSVLYDDIIQISAFKLVGNKIEEFSKYVMPENIEKLSSKITSLTGITKEILLEKGENVANVLKEFVNFIDDGILVAHNARFDVDFIKTKINRYLKINKNYSFVDTLSFSRHLLKNEMKKFSLNKVAQKLKVELKSHHNADFDASACLGIFQELFKKVIIKNVELDSLQDKEEYFVEFKIGAKKALNFIEKYFSENNFNIISIQNKNENSEKSTVNVIYTIKASKKQILNLSNELIQFKTSKILSIFQKKKIGLSELNNLIEPDEYLMDNKIIHITMLVKNNIGKKELYKLISNSHINRLSSRGPIILKSDIKSKLRNNVLIGTSCVNGLFRQIYEKGAYSLNPNFFDYFEIQPLNAYLSITDNEFNKEIFIKKTIDSLIKLARKNNKKIIATSDAHYLTNGQKDLRKIYTETIFAGITHPLKNKDEIGDNKLLGTNSFIQTLIKDYSFDENFVNEIVLQNPKELILDFEEITIVPKGLSTPKDDFLKENSMKLFGHQVDSCKEEMISIVNKSLEKYKIDGKLPEYIQKRVDKELDSIIGHGFYIIYYISYLLVKKSNDDGYVVGSRGSVGSSFIANLMGISDVNPLVPHYRCTHCNFQMYKGIIQPNENVELRNNLENVADGLDLNDAVCPHCNTPLIKEGHDIPFETFLGFAGDKVPDIDLNFSGEYQPIAHNFCKTVFGKNNAFRAGTITTVAEGISKIYAKDFSNKKGLNWSIAEQTRKGLLMQNVKRSTGQHPSGIIVVPNDMDIFDFTPIQFPANRPNNWFTTHFDYHAIHDNILKMDILGHDDPTMLKMLMDIVKENPKNYPFEKVEEIPIVDNETFKLLKKNSEGIIDALGVSEFGTQFVMNMLKEIDINSFADLVKVSGLSHGTDVWANNNQELVAGNTKFGKIDFADTIGCRDDIMIQMLAHNIDNKTSFDIMEFVRKGKPTEQPEKWENYKKIMKEHKVPEWYIWSCEQIKYMFPKAHAVAYVQSALRIAWFKAHRPLDFYQAIFSIRADNFESNAISSNNIEIIKNKIEELKNGDYTANDKNNIHFMELAIEMIEKGFLFESPIINESHATRFIKKDETTLLMPFKALKGVGETSAIKVYENRTTPYTSLEDFKKRGGADKTMINALLSLNKLKFD